MGTINGKIELQEQRVLELEAGLLKEKEERIRQTKEILVMIQKQVAALNEGLIKETKIPKPGAGDLQADRGLQERGGCDDRQGEVQARANLHVDQEDSGAGAGALGAPAGDHRQDRPHRHREAAGRYPVRNRHADL